MFDIIKETARQRLPKRVCLFNGVKVRTYKWTNGVVRTDFEEAIAGELRQEIKGGEHVIIIGGGHGVCSTIAARTGAASVTVYEPGVYWVNVIRETVGLNGVSSSVNVVHGAVGPIYDVWSLPRNAEAIDPGDLRPCDWLVLDCEGAERDILTELEIRPDRISVEMHPPVTVTRILETKLDEIGYNIVKKLESDDVDVLHAIRKEGSTHDA